MSLGESGHRYSPENQAALARARKEELKRLAKKQASRSPQVQKAYETQNAPPVEAKRQLWHVSSAKNLDPHITFPKGYMGEPEVSYKRGLKDLSEVGKISALYPQPPQQERSRTGTKLFTYGDNAIHEETTPSSGYDDPRTVWHDVDLSDEEPEGRESPKIELDKSEKIFSSGVVTRPSLIGNEYTEEQLGSSENESHAEVVEPNTNVKIEPRIIEEAEDEPLLDLHTIPLPKGDEPLYPTLTMKERLGVEHREYMAERTRKLKNIQEIGNEPPEMKPEVGLPSADEPLNKPAEEKVSWFGDTTQIMRIRDPMAIMPTLREKYGGIPDGTFNELTQYYKDIRDIRADLASNVTEETKANREKCLAGIIDLFQLKRAEVKSHLRYIENEELKNRLQTKSKFAVVRSVFTRVASVFSNDKKTEMQAKLFAEEERKKKFSFERDRYLKLLHEAKTFWKEMAGYDNSDTEGKLLRAQQESKNLKVKK